jgi:hypothetical protein
MSQGNVLTAALAASFLESSQGLRISDYSTLDADAAAILLEHGTDGIAVDVLGRYRTPQCPPAQLSKLLSATLLEKLLRRWNAALWLVSSEVCHANQALWKRLCGIATHLVHHDNLKTFDVSMERTQFVNYVLLPTGAKVLGELLSIARPVIWNLRECGSEAARTISSGYTGDVELCCKVSRESAMLLAGSRACIQGERRHGGISLDGLLDETSEHMLLLRKIVHDNPSAICLGPDFPPSLFEAFNGYGGHVNLGSTCLTAAAAECLASASEITIPNTEITCDLAMVLSRHQGPQPAQSALAEGERHKQKWKAIPSLTCQSVTSLSREAATALASYKGRVSMWLKEINSPELMMLFWRQREFCVGQAVHISDEAMSAIRTDKSDDLLFGSLETLSDSAAAALGSLECNTLRFTKLTALSDAAAEGLSNTKCKTLAFGALKTISPKAASSLKKSLKKRLHVEGPAKRKFDANA